MASNGDVIAGGSFTDAGGNPNADWVARWNGISWQPLGTGLNGSVRALAVAPNGDVLAGGLFTNAGSNPAADRVARWDGTAWQALGTGLNNDVLALALAPNGRLVAGGVFTAVGDGSKQTQHIAFYSTGPTLSVGGISAAGGPAGTVVALTGTNLTGATAVTFTPAGGGAGTAAARTYAVASATSITGVTVPAGLPVGAYRVTVTTPAGTSNGLPFVVGPLAAALTTSPTHQLTIYPNPSTGRFTVLRQAGAAATSAVLLNALGQVVRTLRLPTAETLVDLSGLAPGVYALRVGVGGQAVVKRVVLE